jgi:hypothetical protein
MYNKLEIGPHENFFRKIQKPDSDIHACTLEVIKCTVNDIRFPILAVVLYTQSCLH